MAELEAEFEKSRSEIAAYLREFANKLDSDGTGRSGGTGHSETGIRPNESRETSSTTDSVESSPSESLESTNTQKVTLLVGNESATMNPPETVSFSVAVDSDSSLMESGSEESVSFVLRWASDEVESDDELSVH
ncbi:amphi-Trp domain-containing protein (plasmid) [Haladaptatus sp. SPP-AMP-3]|uniref:amphi-Trp domain-containing protein n=1 Tax=Haladaptatus sp. SPP-AMP-3 TaxID=3121295 RepID=UPI003C306F6B